MIPHADDGAEGTSLWETARRGPFAMPGRHPDLAAPPSRSAHRRLRASVLLGATLGVVASGCRGPRTTAEIRVSRGTAPRADVAEMGPDPAPAAWSTSRVELVGAINETLSFRFVVQVGRFPIGEPRLGVEAFSSREAGLAPTTVRLYRMHPVPITDWPGWHIRSLPPSDRITAPLDVLVPVRAPRGGLPGTLRPGETYYFWADVAIPKGTVDGQYESAIRLTSRGQTIGTVDVQLTVWPFVLPDEGPPHVIAEVDHRALFAHHLRYDGRPYYLSVDDWRDAPRRRELHALLNSTMRCLRSHRLTPVLPELAPIVKVNALDKVTVDWGQYDEIVGPCLSGELFFDRVRLPCWPMPIRPVFPTSLAEETLWSQAHRRLLGAYLTECAGHFAENGWLERSYAMPPDAGGIGVEAFERAKTFASLARRSSERIPVVFPFFPQDMTPYGWVGYSTPESADDVDIWMPRAQFYDSKIMAAERSAGRRTWVRIDRPPYSGSLALQARASDVRILGWQAEELAAEVLHAGCINHWPDVEAEPGPADCARFDPNILLYPGRPYGLDEPVESVRLKHLRRSLQDAAYVKLLNDYDLAYITSTLRRSLVPYAGSAAYRTHFADGRPIGWPGDPTLFETARFIMGRELVRAVYDRRPEDRSSAFARTVAWHRFTHDTRTTTVHVDGARARLTTARSTPTVEVECALTLVNRSRSPLVGRVQLGDLPEAWLPALDREAAVFVPVGGSARVRLAARATTMPGGSGGHLPLPIQVAADDGEMLEVEARVACVTALPTDRPIRIDGDLSDWPAGTINTTADFALIAGAPNDGPERARSQPQQATVGFVMRDSDHLYIAVNCKTGPHSALPVSSHKRVLYDDLIPRGEELIEILVDPANAGTRSPTDLYHIVVKQTGADLTEKGIRFDPPCAVREAWPVDLDLATKVTEGRWTAEMRIPLTAFGQVATEHTIWGFNITRYHAADQQFSNWSGARHNAYDPVSLGNLYLP